MRRTLLLTSIAMLAANPLSAVTVASYIFDGSVLTSNDADPSSVAGPIVIGPGRNTGTPVTSFTGAGLTAPDLALSYATRASQRTLADAVRVDTYFQFTVTPEQGTVLSFISLAGFVRSNNGGGFFGPGWRLVSDLTGSSILAEDSNIVAGATAPLEAMTPDLGSLDLSTVPELQNVSTPVTFRVYVNPASDVGQSSKRVDFDDITVDATIVPEPASVSLLALAGLAVLRRRSRRG